MNSLVFCCPFLRISFRTFCAGLLRLTCCQAQMFGPLILLSLRQRSPVSNEDCLSRGPVIRENLGEADLQKVGGSEEISETHVWRSSLHPMNG